MKRDRDRSEDRETNSERQRRREGQKETDSDKQRQTETETERDGDKERQRETNRDRDRDRRNKKANKGERTRSKQRERRDTATVSFCLFLISVECLLVPFWSMFSFCSLLLFPSVSFCCTSLSLLLLSKFYIAVFCLLCICFFVSLAVSLYPPPLSPSV